VSENYKKYTLIDLVEPTNLWSWTIYHCHRQDARSWAALL